jgi:hypothetical protein
MYRKTGALARAGRKSVGRDGMSNLPGVGHCSGEESSKKHGDVTIGDRNVYRGERRISTGRKVHHEAWLGIEVVDLTGDEAGVCGTQGRQASLPPSVPALPCFKHQKIREEGGRVDTPDCSPRAGMLREREHGAQGGGAQDCPKLWRLSQSPPSAQAPRGLTEW